MSGGRRGRPLRPAEPTRRGLLALLAGVCAASLLGPAPGRAGPDDAPVRDQGIGGTGARPDEAAPGEGDRGIGGTGVIGTIRRFGSIVVNDLRIAYPADVAVRIDGEPASAGALRIGQVVRVVAREGPGGLSTGRIEVTSEVVGPVDAVVKGGLTVLGQRVSSAGLRGAWKPGDRVAVGGLRRPDGVVVASLIEARGRGPDRVAGPVRKGPDGALRIGGLRLEGADAALAGRRALVVGQVSDGALKVARVEEAGLPRVPGLRQVSIEAYVGRSGGRLSLGSGLDVAGAAGASVPRRGSVRAVLTTEVARDGRLTVRTLRIDGRGPPGSSPSPDVPDGVRRAPGRLDPRDGRPGTRRDPSGGFGGGYPLDIDTRPGFGDRSGRFGGAGGGPGGGRGGGFGGGPGGGPGPPGGLGGLNGPGGLGGPGGIGPGGGFGGRR